MKLTPTRSDILEITKCYSIGSLNLANKMRPLPTVQTAEYDVAFTYTLDTMASAEGIGIPHGDLILQHLPQAHNLNSIPYPVTTQHNFTLLCLLIMS